MFETELFFVRSRCFSWITLWVACYLSKVTTVLSPCHVCIRDELQMTPVPSYTNSLSCTAVIWGFCLCLADVIFGFMFIDFFTEKISSTEQALQKRICLTYSDWRVSKVTNYPVDYSVWFGYESFMIRWFDLKCCKMVCLNMNVPQN